jgi:hypothetical protein
MKFAFWAFIVTRFAVSSALLVVIRAGVARAAVVPTRASSKVTNFT